MSFSIKRTTKSLVAGVLTAGLLLGGLTTPAFAGDGGGSGSGGGGGTAAGDMSVVWKVKESWAASRAGVETALTEMGYPSNGSPASNTVIDKAINEANAECAASYTGTDDPGCRLVAVGIAVSDGKWYSVNHIDNASEWGTAWSNETNGKTYDYKGTSWTAQTSWTDKKGTHSVSTLALEDIDANLGAALRVIVLAKNQPAPPTYTLSITTNQQSGNVKAGTSGAVHDVIHAAVGFDCDERVVREATDDWLLVDFLMRNTDRRYNNFGLIRDVESLQVRPAPIHDTGASLWSGELDVDGRDWFAKPFYAATGKPSAMRQLRLVENWERFNLDALADWPDEVVHELSHMRMFASERLNSIKEQLIGRIDTVRRMRDGRMFHVSTRTILTEGYDQLSKSVAAADGTLAQPSRKSKRRHRAR